MLLRGGVLQAIGKYQQYGHWREVAGVPESIELIGAGKPVQVLSMQPSHSLIVDDDACYQNKYFHTSTRLR